MKPARKRPHRERVLELLREGPKTTVDLHASYVLNPAVVVMRLRKLGHNIKTDSMPNGMALYSLPREAA